MNPMIDLEWRLESNGDYWTMAYTDNGGSLRRKSIGSKKKLPTARQAERECQRIAADMAREPSRREILRKAPTIEVWEEAYLELRDDEIDEATAELHRNTFAYLALFLGKDTRLDRVTAADADDWRAWLKKQPVRRGKGKGGKLTLSDETVSSHVRRAKVIFGRAVKRRHIALNPFAEVNGASAPKPKRWAFVTREELAEILDECPDHGWRALFALCRLAGLRRGEALALNWSDLDWVGRMVSVPNPNPSGRETTKRHLREVPMEPELYRILKECQEQAPGPECPDYSPKVCPITKLDSIERRAKAIVEAADIEPYTKPFHVLRKNLESEWLAKYPIMDVCGWLGHSPAVAAKHYQKSTAETIAQVTGAKMEVARG